MVYEVETNRLIPLYTPLFFGWTISIRWGYSQLRHRVPYTMFFFGFGLWAKAFALQKINEQKIRNKYSQKRNCAATV
jgi:hypothetical protein